ncbi:MATE family efflux transporter [Demequina muriae]|uniref:Probable multidrug resistance protein NorM n=1 Tax=Demequina muriae TaxID=3051664 RepID=A0ABT8GJA1_9MICO|nr:MATE family efflux transporter [Demequina sp. EGI L300058]MDN4481324.1 MATE family efflux transporter [Demequina sp. EGI L300058]
MTSRRDLFRGLPHRRALSLAWPMIVANVSVPLVGLVDTAMLGHFSDTQNLGAVAAGAIVLSAAYWVLSFLRLGTTSLVGRAVGAGRPLDTISHLQRSLMLAGVIAAAILVLQWVLIPLAMTIVAPAGEVRELATAYGQIRVHSLPAVLGTSVITGYFIGSQDTRRPLAIAVVVNLLNLVLDIAFVGGLSWGAAGAAWATMIAEWVGLAVAAVLLWRFLDPTLRERLRKWRGQGLRRRWRALLTMNADLAVRTALLYVALTFLTAAGGRISEDVLAANAILLQVTLLASYGLDGYAHAAEAMSAKALGTRNLTEFHRVNAAATLPALGIAAAFTALFLVAQDPFISLMTSLPDLAATTAQYFHWAAWLPLISVAAYQLDGVFIGSGQSRIMRNTMLVAVVGVYLPVFFVPAWVTGEASNDGLWLAFTLLNVARGVLLGAAYWRLTRTRGWLRTADAGA